MNRHSLKSKLLGSIAFAALASLSILLPTAAQAAKEKVVSVYNWSDYIGDKVLADFQKETGIKVNYDTLDQNETLEAKLLAGKSGYDVVVPTIALFGERGIKNGIYQKLDKSKLKNYGNIDKDVLQLMSKSDPGNDYAIPWVSGVNVIGYNEDKIKKLMPDAPVNSLRMLFDPAVLAKFKSCGVFFLDSSTDVITTTLLYLGLDPNSEIAADYLKVEEHWKKLRPFVKKFHSSAYINAMVGGDACLVLGFSTDIAVVQKRSNEAGKTTVFKGVIPIEGSYAYVDSMMIPKDAPNLENAYKFMDFALRPEISAATANFIGAKTANAKAVEMGLIDKQFTSDIMLFPPAETYKRLFSIKLVSPATEQIRNRLWTKIKSGR